MALRARYHVLISHPDQIIEGRFSRDPFAHRRKRPRDDVNTGRHTGSRHLDVFLFVRNFLLSCFDSQAPLKGLDSASRKLS